MVYRIYVEKKSGLDHEAQNLKSDLLQLLGIGGVQNVRVLNRYDAEGIDRKLFDYAVHTVFSEPQLDVTGESLPEAELLFAVEPVRPARGIGSGMYPDHFPRGKTGDSYRENLCA